LKFDVKVIQETSVVIYGFIFFQDHDQHVQHMQILLPTHAFLEQFLK
jgi:hypothetical protein